MDKTKLIRHNKKKTVIRDYPATVGKKYTTIGLGKEISANDATLKSGNDGNSRSKQTGRNQQKLKSYFQQAKQEKALHKNQVFTVKK